MKAIIVDVDGTVADCEHRRYHLDTNNWPGFFGAMADDGVFTHTIEVINALRAQGYKVLIVTARPDDNDYKQVTQTWLAENGIAYDGYYMRAGGDYRKDNIVKQEILGQILNDGFEPVMAFDDRTQVVEMWREMGIPCMQVNEGDFDKPKLKWTKEGQGQIMLEMLIGPSGAGKSTFATKNFPDHEIISSDNCRVTLFGDYTSAHVHDPDNLAKTWSYTHALVKTDLEHGRKVVLDSTGLRRKDRLAVLELVPAGYLVRYNVIDRDYDEKIRDRGWRPEALIDKHHKAFKSALKDIMKGDGQGNVIVKDHRPSNIKGR